MWTTLGNPESREAARQETLQRTYIRGTITDRNGTPLSWSNKANGYRSYIDGETKQRAFSTVVGYYSPAYGTFGLEKTFNTQLISSKCKSGDKQVGNTVQTTLDTDLQTATYSAISDIANGAAVVLDAKTGEIVSMASTPSFIQSDLEDNWSDYSQKTGLFLPNAYKSTFAPGSDFKIITACAVIDNGVDGTNVNDRGSYTFKNGQTITNYDSRSFGSIGLKGAIRNSSNVYFITKALEMGADNLEASLRKFKLGEDIPLDFTTLTSNLDFEDRRDEVVGSIAFGQGRTEVTPLYMAMACQSIVNHGTMLKPYLIKSVTAGNGTKDDTYKDSAEELTTVTSKETADEVVSCMEVAADHYGFGYYGDQGWHVAAKTGTAQTGKSTNAWIVTSLLDSSNEPQYVVVIMAADQHHDGIYYKNQIEDIFNATAKYDASKTSDSNAQN